MGFVFLFLTIYFLFAITGLEIYKHKKLRAWLSGIGILFLVLILFFINTLFSWMGGLGVSGGLGGGGLVVLLFTAIAILMPILGFFSGIISRYFFEKTNSSHGLRWTKKIIGVLILAWPLIIVGVVSAVTYPEQKRRKEAKIAMAEKRAVHMAAQKREYDERKRAEIKLYEEKQRDRVYRFNLADHDIDLKAFKYLRVSLDSEAEYYRGLTLWGKTLEDFENSNGIIANNDIYRIHVQTNKIKDDCPNTDLETALIWCREHKVANSINYRPYELGRLAFEKFLKKRQMDIFLLYARTDLSEKTSGITPIPFNKERIWRINKTPEFENIHSDIYLACDRLSEREKSLSRGGDCYIGFRLNEGIFVNMFIQINSKSMIESDSRTAVRQSLKYWDLLRK